MDKRSVMAVVVLVIFALTFVVVVSYSQDDVTSVEDSAFNSRMRPQVLFPHDEHNEQAEIASVFDKRVVESQSLKNKIVVEYCDVITHQRVSSDNSSGMKRIQLPSQPTTYSG